MDALDALAEALDQVELQPGPLDSSLIVTPSDPPLPTTTVCVPPTGVAVPSTLLSACFAFLTPKELMNTHATSKGWQVASAHPLTFRNQIQIRVKENYGIWSSGPRVEFKAPGPMRLAASSSLFGNFRILSLIDRNEPSKLVEMMSLAGEFSSIHTLNITSPRLDSDSRLSGPQVLTRLTGLTDLLESKACKYLAVLRLDLPLEFFLQLLSALAVAPRTLHHLQLTLLDLPTNHKTPRLLPNAFAEVLAPLQLKTLVVACTESFLPFGGDGRKDGRVSSGQDDLLHQFGRGDGDLEELALVMQKSSSLEQLRWMIPIDMEEKTWPIAQGGWESYATRNGFRVPLALEYLTLSSVSSWNSKICIDLLTNIAPEVKQLTISGLESAKQPSDPALCDHTLYSFPSSVRSSLRDLRIRLEDGVRGVHWLIAAGLRNLEKLHLGIAGHRSGAEKLEPLFLSMRSLLELRLFGSFFDQSQFGDLKGEMFKPLAKLRLLHGVRWYLPNWGERQQGKMVQDCFPSLTELLVTRFTERHDLTSDFLQFLDSFPQMERFGWGTKPLSKPIIRARYEHILAIRRGFRAHAEFWERQDALTVKRPLMGSDPTDPTPRRIKKQPCKCTSHPCSCGSDARLMDNDSEVEEEATTGEGGEMLKAKLLLERSTQQAFLATLAQAEEEERKTRAELASAGDNSLAHAPMSLSEKFRAARAARQKKPKQFEMSAGEGNAPASSGLPSPVVIAPPHAANLIAQAAQHAAAREEEWKKHEEALAHLTMSAETRAYAKNPFLLPICNQIGSCLDQSAMEEEDLEKRFAAKKVKKMKKTAQPLVTGVLDSLSSHLRPSAQQKYEMPSNKVLPPVNLEASIEQSPPVPSVLEARPKSFDRKKSAILYPAVPEESASAPMTPIVGSGNPYKGAMANQLQQATSAAAKTAASAPVFSSVPAAALGPSSKASSSSSSTPASSPQRGGSKPKVAASPPSETSQHLQWQHASLFQPQLSLAPQRAARLSLKLQKGSISLLQQAQLGGSALSTPKSSVSFASHQNEEDELAAILMDLGVSEADAVPPTEVILPSLHSLEIVAGCHNGVERVAQDIAMHANIPTRGLCFHETPSAIHKAHPEAEAKNVTLRYEIHAPPPKHYGTKITYNWYFCPEERAAEMMVSQSSATVIVLPLKSHRETARLTLQRIQIGDIECEHYFLYQLGGDEESSQQTRVNFDAWVVKTITAWRDTVSPTDPAVFLLHLTGVSEREMPGASRLAAEHIDHIISRTQQEITGVAPDAQESEIEPLQS